MDRLATLPAPPGCSPPRARGVQPCCPPGSYPRSASAHVSVASAARISRPTSRLFSPVCPRAGTGASLRDLMNRMGHDSMRAALICQHATRNADRTIAVAIENLLAEHATDPDHTDDPDDGAAGALEGLVTPVARRVMPCRHEDGIRRATRPLTWAFALERVTHWSG